ncbi:hypothetical protein ABZW96_35415 [Nocardia sp. NPDC004168]|uniref:hypothetical protein n=1 Tax=Nocardia sp. NPDC004168 TaxID=3154452 RepID=UPI0033B225BF
MLIVLMSRAYRAATQACSHISTTTITGATAYSAARPKLRSATCGPLLRPTVAVNRHASKSRILRRSIVIPSRAAVAACAITSRIGTEIIASIPNDSSHSSHHDTPVGPPSGTRLRPTLTPDHTSPTTMTARSRNDDQVARRWSMPSNATANGTTTLRTRSRMPTHLPLLTCPNPLLGASAAVLRYQTATKVPSTIPAFVRSHPPAETLLGFQLALANNVVQRLIFQGGQTRFRRCQAPSEVIRM